MIEKRIGVYCLKNLKKGKRYIGSSINLTSGEIPFLQVGDAALGGLDINLTI